MLHICCCLYRVCQEYGVGFFDGRCGGRVLRLCDVQSPNLPAFGSHQYVFVVVFSSPEYLTDLQGRSVDDPGLYWDFYGSSVCGEQMLPFISLYAETLKTGGWGLFCCGGGGS